MHIKYNRKKIFPFQNFKVSFTGMLLWSFIMRQQIFLFIVALFFLVARGRVNLLVVRNNLRVATSEKKTFLSKIVSVVSKHQVVWTNSRTTAKIKSNSVDLFWTQWLRILISVSKSEKIVFRSLECFSSFCSDKIICSSA